MKLLFSVLFSFLLLSTNAKSHKLEFRIKNQRQNIVYLFLLKGDKQIKTDTFKIDNLSVKQPADIEFILPENAPAGMYRIILGQTRVAELMNEPPQHIDFIFNHEDIFFKTNFKAPHDSLNIIQSEENNVWFDFKKKESNLKKQLKESKMELNYFQQTNNLAEAEKQAKIYNELQHKRDNYISETIRQHKNFFASKIIAMYREPFLDGKLSAEKRDEIFKAEFFNHLDFTDEELINTTIYSTTVFTYLMSYAKKGLTREQQEQEFIKGADVICTNTEKDEKVYEFILDFLMRGFEQLNLENALVYLAGKYNDSTCSSDNKTTAERRLLFYKTMKINTVVPDFTLNDVNDDPVTLSEVAKEATLLIFWAGWCPHCNLMIPKIKEWYSKQDKKRVEVVTVSLDTSEKEWKAKVDELGIESWFNLSDLKSWDGEVANKYNIYGTPTLFLLDKNRKIIAKPKTINDLNKYIFIQQ